jgi:predicted metal-dependent enzyme (double-stranded beta helix superfamily)
LLQPLVDNLCSRGPLERSTSDMAALLAATRGSWLPSRPLLLCPGGYTRSCAYADERFEVLLLNWAAGAASAIHDHGGQHCWMQVLEGQLVVDDYLRTDAGERPGFARVEARDSRLMNAGDLDLRSGRFDLHRVSASAGVPALSLHIYAGPLTEFLAYDESTHRSRTVLSTYDEVLRDVGRLSVPTVR